MKKYKILFIILIPLLSIHAQIEERGAYNMPYLRYEADAGIYGGGAQFRGPSYNQSKIESEASERKYIALPGQGAYVQWRIQDQVNGITLRFTMPDSPDGTGLQGMLALYINDIFISNISLSSYYSWQYFYKNGGTDNEPHNDPSVGNPRMRFDEMNWVLPSVLESGDIIKLQKNLDDGIEYGIDFIEAELVPDKIEKPIGYIDVTEAPFNAIPNDNIDDFRAFSDAISYANANNVNIYIPEGEFYLSNQIQLDQDNRSILGAGIWYTKLHFTEKPTNNRYGGIYSSGSNMHISNFSMSSAVNYRGAYRAFGQHWGKNSIIEDIWITHFSVGFWVADYKTKQHNTADGLIVRNCRIRNTYADGLNFAKGSSNCILEHSNIRNTGDDAMASWSSNVDAVGPNTGNIFRFNTVENTCRAAGLGIFGGRQHVAHHCIISDSFAGPGIRVNSTFEAHPFATDSDVNIHDITVERCGTRDNIWGNKLGALDLNVRFYDVNNIRFDKIDIIDSQVDGVHISKAKGIYALHDVYLKNINITGTAKDNAGAGHGIFVSNNSVGWIENNTINITGAFSGNIFEQSSTFEIREGTLSEPSVKKKR
ncbi:hypothetical protein VOI54_16595 [Tamlana sp. 2201CG12-4]|uniref:hypothetical protein n=1 Tax=Tamlana sp. 2201CG12-4 TaxID=3112582 RepID=UPI002DB58B0F|nr:hypothetical protein [Tamlana sp. 2201CG12-4]MEC3908649.1 hypothetical protein [Tamlana sp. 2201CG12-4]